MAKNRRRARKKRTKRGPRQVKQIDVLPDDVLLGIFDFCVNMYPNGNKTEIEAWQSLVHVCRRWRSLVLGSPRRLNLRLYCTRETPARDTLEVWPALPLIVTGYLALSPGTDNVIAALEQSNRVCQVTLHLDGWQLEEVLAPMQVPFPELTDLRLLSPSPELMDLHLSLNDETPPVIKVIPDSFLDGSAPRLRHFLLSGIPFPGLPKLLLSANHLVQLWLSDIPHSGYIPPEASGVLLSALSSLRTLSLEFESPQSRPDAESRSLPPLKRSILPALDEWYFKGVIDYLEDLVIFVDAPQLNYFYIVLFNQIDFDTPRLAQFFDRPPKFRKNDAHLEFYETAGVALLASAGLEIVILCREPDRQLSSVAQVCNSLPLLSMVEDLYVEHRYLGPVWKNDAIENTLWLELLLPFPAVKNLYLSKEFAPGIAAALQELLGITEMALLPGLQNIFVEEFEPSGPFQKYAGQFVAARRLSDRPIAISVWNKNSNIKSM